MTDVRKVIGVFDELVATKGAIEFPSVAFGFANLMIL